MDLGFGPFEGNGRFLVCGDELADGLAQLAGVGRIESAQGFAAENAEPDLYQVEPGGVGGAPARIMARLHLTFGYPQSGEEGGCRGAYSGG